VNGQASPAFVAGESPSRMSERLAAYARSRGWEVVRDSPTRTSCCRWIRGYSEVRWITLHASDFAWNKPASFAVAAETRDAQGRLTEGGYLGAASVPALFEVAVSALEAHGS
jgi:uncharacterized protein YbdZ (MbtH family)